MTRRASFTRASRGQSFGGIYGTKLLAIEPSIRAGVANVPGGPIIEVARLSFRFLVGIALATRVPSLANRPPAADPAAGGAVVPQFEENIPLRDLLPVVNTDPTTTPIQQVIDNTEWASHSGNPVAYAPHIVMSPLEGMQSKAVIVQFAKGDKTVPNPTVSALLRAGDLHDHISYFRNDKAFAGNPAFPKNPHTHLTNSLVPLNHPAVVAAALAAQAQIATFFASNGTTVIDPDSIGELFELPLLPAAEIAELERLNYIP